MHLHPIKHKDDDKYGGGGDAGEKQGLSYNADGLFHNNALRDDRNQKPIGVSLQRLVAKDHAGAVVCKFRPSGFVPEEAVLKQSLHLPVVFRFGDHVEHIGDGFVAVFVPRPHHDVPVSVYEIGKARIVIKRQGELIGDGFCAVFLHQVSGGTVQKDSPGKDVEYVFSGHAVDVGVQDALMRAVFF